MRRSRRLRASLAIFAAVQLAAAAWVLTQESGARAVDTIGHTLAGPLVLLGRLDRLWQHGQFPRDVPLLLIMAAIALLPWSHAWRARPVMLALSLLGSLLWALAGWLSTIDHL